MVAEPYRTKEDSDAQQINEWLQIRIHLATIGRRKIPMRGKSMSGSRNPFKLKFIIGLASPD